jgi:hypothetical protein
LRTFHIHALLSIYNQGLLVTVSAGVGIDDRDRVESSPHTHDTTGRFRFGAGTLGSLKDDGDNRVLCWSTATRSRLGTDLRTRFPI